MKYQISVDHDFGKEMDRKLAADQDVKQISNFDGGEIMMVGIAHVLYVGREAMQIVNH